VIAKINGHSFNIVFHVIRGADCMQVIVYLTENRLNQQHNLYWSTFACCLHPTLAAADDFCKSNFATQVVNVAPGANEEVA
jgi:hypothetical protein